MYNRYLDANNFVLLDPEPQPHAGPNQPRQGQPHQGFSQPQGQRPGNWQRPPQPIRSKNDLAGDVVRGLGQLLDGVKQHFSLEKFDTGDILLVLIILFLYLEGDNLELVITLGLMLLLGLGDDKPKEADS